MVSRPKRARPIRKKEPKGAHGNIPQCPGECNLFDIGTVKGYREYGSNNRKAPFAMQEQTKTLAQTRRPISLRDEAVKQIKLMLCDQFRRRDKPIPSQVALEKLAFEYYERYFGN